MSEKRWTVDSVEEGIAAVHQDGGRMAHVPAWILPSGVREGDVLSLEHTPGADTSLLRVSIDREATDHALRRSREQLDRRLPHDPGGDIVL